MRGKRIYMMGICGIGMGSVAGYLTEQGVEVWGSDDNIYPPMSELLKKLKVRIKKGYSPDNLKEPIDLVIVGNAISGSNPEAQALKDSGIVYESLPQFLEKHILPGKRSLVVAGTHGKTTTTALLGWVLEFCNTDPSVIVGGVVKGWDKSYRTGQGNYFAIEGDEYDSAFFDKVPKFLHYRPHDAIMTGIEFDHADIYSSLEAIKAEFEKLSCLIPADGNVVAYGENSALSEVLKRFNKRKVTYGLDGDFDYTARALRPGPKGLSFDVYKSGKRVCDIKAPLLGKQNALNIAAVYALCDLLSLDRTGIKAGIESFKGVKRRQELLLDENGVMLVEDFAHHPTAIELTIEGFRMAYPERRIWAIFEPRTNTSRRAFFQKDLPPSFRQADLVIIADVFNADKLPQDERLDPQRVVKDINDAGGTAWYIPSVEEIVEKVSKEVRKGDIVMIMSNGGFGGIYAKMTGALRKTR